MTELKESWSRVNTLHISYYNMAKSAYSTFLMAYEHQQKLLESNPDVGSNEWEQLHKLEIKSDHSGIKTIVFSGMCLEAAIYDFSAIHFGDKFVKEHLDKLDMLSKWVTMPKFICDKQISKDKPPYACLKQLIKDRNNLVHHKSETFSASEEAYLRLQKYNQNRERAIHNAFKTLVLVALEMDDLLGHHSPLFFIHPDREEDNRLTPKISSYKALYNKAFSK